MSSKSSSSQLKNNRQLPQHREQQEPIKIHTLGCRLNVYESEVMRAHAQAQGLEDTIIINTCAVTNEAERQSRQTVRRALKENPGARVIVTGCSAQQNPTKYAAIEGVDRVLGNHEKMLASSFAKELPERVRVNDIFEISETANHLISGFEDHVRSFIQIQNGCNHRCTFCSIPFGRGNNRSVPAIEILTQIQSLVRSGTKEIVLTGVDITDYQDPTQTAPHKLGNLLDLILKEIPDLPRIRLSSIDPVEVDPLLLKLIQEEKRIMPHLHISLQAGDDMILKRMKRRHLRQDVRQFCQAVRTFRPEVIFGGDVIAGFPTETDEMFQNTFEFIQELDLTYLHVFPYSARAGTPAARMPQVEKQIIKERAKILRKLGRQQQAKYYSSLIGQNLQVLFEKAGQGHSETFAKCQLVSPSQNKLIQESHLQGQILKAQVVEASDKMIFVSIPHAEDALLKYDS